MLNHYNYLQRSSNRLQDFLSKIILEAGKLSLTYRDRLDNITFEHKSEKDIVTEADKAVELFIIKSIHEVFPDHSILGEETGVHLGSSDYRWIIDPIDGTISFLYGQPFYSISIALEKNGILQQGAVFAPVMNELFQAKRGEGATLNGKSIATSTRPTLSKSVLATGFACVRAGAKRNNLPYLGLLLPKILGVRRFGSAAMDMCYVACGRFDGFWELNLNIYDIAAGQLILQEAGGVVTDFKGNPIKEDCKEIVSVNAFIGDELRAVFAIIDKA
jgi:myo-inositol-1(or 4)-monophosphatase